MTEERPKIRAEMHSFSNTLSGMVAQISIDVFGQGRFELRVYDRDGVAGGEPGMAFYHNGQQIYAGPIWQSEEDLFQALATMTRKRLENNR